ncbi:hypothetical protein SALBM217S_04208 [Streptomyces griseoloalbus]
MPHLQRALIVLDEFGALQRDLIGLPGTGHRKADGNAVHEVRGAQTEDDLSVVAVLQMVGGILRGEDATARESGLVRPAGAAQRARLRRGLAPIHLLTG